MEPKRLPLSPGAGFSLCPKPRRNRSTPPSKFLNIHFNIILSSSTLSSNCPFPLRLSHQNPAYTRTSPLYSTCHLLFHLLLSLIRQIIFSEQHKSWNSSSCSLPNSSLFLLFYASIPRFFLTFSACVFPPCDKPSFTLISSKHMIIEHNISFLSHSSARQHWPAIHPVFLHHTHKRRCNRN